MYTKNMLMLVILSAGILTALTATTIQATPAFASKDECEKNNDNNCNKVEDRGQLITIEDNCKGGSSGDANGGSSGDGSTSGAAGTSGENGNNFNCDNELLDPNTGNSNLFGQSP
jgi:hypothetical protein